jgi:hypothetical protein
MDLRVHPLGITRISDKPISSLQLIVEMLRAVNLSGNLTQRTLAARSYDDPDHRADNPEPEECHHGSATKEEEQVQKFEHDRDDESYGQSRSYVIETLVGTGAFLRLLQEVNDELSIRH